MHAHRQAYRVCEPGFGSHSGVYIDAPGVGVQRPTRYDSSSRLRFGVGQ